MKTIIKYRYVLFYCFSIAFVIILFNIVTDYGQNHLRAAQSVGGTYIVVSDRVPGCFQGSPLILNLEQSGIYLAGNLSDKTVPVSLNGNIRDNNIVLNSMRPCNLTLTASFDKQGIEGYLKDDSSGLTIPVNLKKQAETGNLPPIGH